MRKINLIKRPGLFQGKRYLNKDKCYFEGWYFKLCNGSKNIAFIPGININKNEKRAFIQIITDDLSYFVDYDIDQFEFGDNPFYVKIGCNYFSKSEIIIDINDEKSEFVIFGIIKFSNSKNIDVGILKPNIMGIFSYVPFMECNHAILCMKNDSFGIINLNDNDLVFDRGIGYIEKDWGCSFPKSYVWCQGNCFEKNDASFMLSIASIPFKIFSFTGVICSLIVGDKEYRFSTYNNTKIIKYDVSEGLNIVLRKGKYILSVKSESVDGYELAAPVKGQMNRKVIESISAVIVVTLKMNGKVIFSDTSNNCGLEIA